MWKKSLMSLVGIFGMVLMLPSCSVGSHVVAPSSNGTNNNNTTTKSLIMSHLAGSLGGWGSDDGIGSAASFGQPWGIITDGTNLYVADTNNYTIRKIVIATGEVTTLAGQAGVSGSSDSTDGTGATASFALPFGITTDGTNLYVADTYNDTIRKIVIATGNVTTLAGQAGVFGSSDSTDGTGATASFGQPYGITTDGTNLYVADTRNYTIRKIVIVTGEVTTLAGQAGVYGASDSTDGTGATASFWLPSGITTDGTNLYVADQANDTIRKIIIATGNVTTLAGQAGVIGYSDSTDGTGATASFNYPIGITINGTNLYVADTSNNIIRKIVISTGEVTTLAGQARVYGSSDSTDGTGATASFAMPFGTTTYGTNLYVVDSCNDTIRKIVISTGEVTTLAGQAGVYGSSDSTDGTGATASFAGPLSITNDGTNLYVADTSNNIIRKIVISTGEVTTLAGQAGVSGSSDSTDGTGATASFYGPEGITTDGTNLYVTDGDRLHYIIREIVISTGAVTTLAGSGRGSSDSTDGTGATASFNHPQGITTDGTNLYVVDTNNDTVRKIVISTGAVTTLAGQVGVSGSSDSTDGTGATASFSGPVGITTDGINLYVVDTNNYTIRKIVISTGNVTTLAGQAGVSGSSDSTDGTGATANFNYPTGVTINGANLYVADTGNNVIRKILVSTGNVTTFAGIEGHFGYRDGTLDKATLYEPNDISYVAGKFFITEGNNDIREIQWSD